MFFPQLYKKICALFWRCVDIIFPPLCPVTGHIVDRAGMLHSSFWSKLRFISDPLCPSCGLPFDFAYEEEEEEEAEQVEAEGIEINESIEEGNDLKQNMLCGHCIAHPPHYDSHRSALIYDDHSRKMILRFKYGDHHHLTQSFAPMLSMAGYEALEQANIIIPVPLHYWRFLWRRFNQSALLAASLSKTSGTPWSSNLLKRTKHTQLQRRKNHEERVKNVKNAFTVPADQITAIKGKNIILIDDVYTTGATVNSCAKALKKAGAGAVHIITLARVCR